MCTCAREKFIYNDHDDDHPSLKIRSILMDEIGCLVRKCNNSKFRCKLDHPMYKIITHQIEENCWALVITSPMELLDMYCRLNVVMYRIYYNGVLVDFAFTPVRKDNKHTILQFINANNKLYLGNEDCEIHSHFELESKMKHGNFQKWIRSAYSNISEDIKNLQIIRAEALVYKTVQKLYGNKRKIVEKLSELAETTFIPSPDGKFAFMFLNKEDTNFHWLQRLNTEHYTLSKKIFISLFSIDPLGLKLISCEYVENYPDLLVYWSTSEPATLKIQLNNDDPVYWILSGLDDILKIILEPILGHVKNGPLSIIYNYQTYHCLMC